MVSFSPLTQTELPFCADQLLRHRLDFGPIPTAHRDVCSRPLKSSLLIRAGTPNHLAVECAGQAKLQRVSKDLALSPKERDPNTYTRGLLLMRW